MEGNCGWPLHTRFLTPLGPMGNGVPVEQAFRGVDVVAAQGVANLVESTMPAMTRMLLQKAQTESEDDSGQRGSDEGFD